MARNYKQLYAIKKEQTIKLKELFPELDNSSGIYCYERKICYIGQSVDIIDRIISHLNGYEQHIDLSIKKWKLKKDGRSGGWDIKVLEKCDKSKLNEREQFWIKKFQDDGIELYNITSGSQGSGKTDIGERKERGGYRKGKEYGYNQAIAKIQKLERQRHQTKKDGTPSAIAIKAKNEWDRILKEELE